MDFVQQCFLYLFCGFNKVRPWVFENLMAMSGISEQFKQKSSADWNIFFLGEVKCVKLMTGEKPWNDCNGYSSHI